MDKRRARYEQAERTTTAEQRVKALRLEVADLRKQLFRAQESARIANEEADVRAQAQRQSGADLRAKYHELADRYEAALTEIAMLECMPMGQIVLARLAQWWDGLRAVPVEVRQ